MSSGEKLQLTLGLTRVRTHRRSPWSNRWNFGRSRNLYTSILPQALHSAWRPKSAICLLISIDRSCDSDNCQRGNFVCSTSLQILLNACATSLRMLQWAVPTNKGDTVASHSKTTIEFFAFPLRHGQSVFLTISKLSTRNGFWEQRFPSALIQSSNILNPSYSWKSSLAIQPPASGASPNAPSEANSNSSEPFTS